MYQELRFVLVEMNGVQSILASTSLDLEPLSIIRLYSYRFRIECMFRELKQQIGAFCYHFWSKHMPKLSYYQKTGEPGPLEQVDDERSRQNILKAVRAIEMHMALSCIAMGILQCISICSLGKLSSEQLRYQRTPSKGRMGLLYGYIRLGKEQVRRGGKSNPRNKSLMKMFNLIDIGEHAGSGVPNIFNVWEDEGWEEPVITESFDPDRTSLTLKFVKKQALLKWMLLP